jgi:tRNA pseudouridine38-40 synthase
MRLLGVVEYDGTDFAGFQLQAHRDRIQPRTVQAELEHAIAAATGSTVRIMCAGRTDAGVHARGQVVHFDVDAPPREPFDRVRLAINAHLPADICLQTLEEAPAGFHCRYSARARTYRYQILNAPSPSPLTRRFAYHVRRPLDVPRMTEAAQHLIGVHDFRAFAAGETGDVTLRHFYRAQIDETSAPWPKPDTIWHNLRWRAPDASETPPTANASEARLVGIEVEANAFLRHMVRRIAGTLVRVGLGRLEPDAVAAIVASREKRLAGPAVPAAGLCLLRVTYDPDDLHEEQRDNEDVFA